MQNINTSKYLEAFPFSHYIISSSGSELFCLKEVENAKFLHRLKLNDSESSQTLSEVQQVSKQDFSNRTVIFLKYDESKQLLYLKLDEDNSENTNLYRLNLANDSLEKLTSEARVSTVWLTEDYKFATFNSQVKNVDGTFTTTAKKIDLTTKNIETLFDDTSLDFKISWSPVYQLSESLFAFAGDHLARRQNGNILVFDKNSKSFLKVLPTEWEKTLLWIADPDPNVKEMIFSSQISGFDNLYSLNIETKEVKPVTKFNQRNSSRYYIYKNKIKSYVYTFPQVEENSTKLVLVDTQKDEMREKILKGSYYIKSADDFIFLMKTSNDKVPSIFQLDHSLEPSKSISLTQASPDQLENCTYEFLKYRSFDDLEIPAYLIKPKNKPIRAAIVIAFYGGEDYYSIFHQMFSELGIAVLSPAVRGSWGWGKEWERKLKGDLGGNEILDVIWGAKFLEQTLGLAQNKIGVFGQSHGGYATLRAVTFPKKFKNITSDFEFGFAISEAGFADLVNFFETSRIADWLVDLLGPFDRNLYLERSPITYFENLNCPILIVHGTNDSRVPYSTMEEFVARLKASSKPHELLIHKDQGHHAGNKLLKKIEYEQVVRFLNSVIKT